MTVKVLKRCLSHVLYTLSLRGGSSDTIDQKVGDRYAFSNLRALNNLLDRVPLTYNDTSINLQLLSTGLWDNILTTPNYANGVQICL